jgi:hypothetical protein
MSAKQKQGGDNRRAAHMGWLMVSAVVEQCIKISPVQFSKAKLMELGYPESFLWPVFQDYDGAKMLVEAVMARNVDQIRMLNGRHPLADFGLKKWIGELEAKQEHDRSLVVKVVKKQALPRGFSLEHILEANSVTGERRLLRVLMNGKQRVAVEVLKTETAAE